MQEEIMTDLIKSEVIGAWGKITLNSPRTYNALNAEMATEISRLLDLWQEDKSISALMIDSDLEKAFCAGGDVVSLYKLAKAGEVETARSFFSKEYTLDLKIHNYPKPIVVFGNSIVMGGGVGIHNGASHRIMTDKTVFAMPEVSIGFFPDVGASYFLSRLKDNMGLFVGASGCRLTGSDCKFMGLTDFLLAEDKLSQVKRNLLTMPLALDVEDDLNAEFESLSISQDSETPFMKHYDLIKSWVRSGEVADLVAGFESYDGDNEWMLQTKKTFLTGCPSTWYIVEKMMREGKGRTVEECFQMEARIAETLMDEGNFFEGVRALLVEKDRNPKWNAKTLEEVNTEKFNKIFTGI
jgi:enoyl-CoA hydratase/carnithine racemase